jgi:hypothetical protein
MRADASPNEESRRKCTPERQAALRLGRRKEEMDVSSARFAACLLGAALLISCAGQKASDSSPTPTPAASAVPIASGPASALVSAAGTPGSPALDAVQRAEVATVAAGTPGGMRARLRYAVAAGEDGKPRLVVYDGGGLGPDGRQKGRPHEYILFRVLNAKHGEHYDPQQNAVIAAIPPPPQRDTLAQ